MFTQEEIDSVLSQAQSAVDALAADVSGTPAPAAQARAQMSSGSPALAPTTPGGKVDRILGIQVPVVVRLAERAIPVSEVLKMSPGTILEFDRTVDMDLDLLVNNHQIGSGVAVKVNERFGLRIQKLGDLGERIRSLGG